MHFFVTGASGWIGSATVAELLGAGHRVSGLARSEASAERLEAAGAVPVRGDLEDLAALADAAAASDGVIHLAFRHDVAWSGGFATAAAVDRRALEAMGAALAGSGRPFVLASGLAGVTGSGLATENDGLVARPEVRSIPAGLRHATALLALSLRGIGVRSAVLRYPLTVHGDGDHGFVATLVTIARQSGRSAYVGDGANRWAAVHLSDAARLTRLAAESAPAGSVLHAVGDVGVPFALIAQSIGRHLSVPVESIDAADAVEHFSHLGPIVMLEAAADASITRDLLGWAPSGPTLLEDLELGHYFRAA